MEKNTSRNYGQQGDNPQGNQKKYPGYTPDESAETSSDEFLDENQNSSNEYKDAALANKGPVRNPNYHDLEDDTEGNSRSSSSKSSSKVKKNS